MGADHTVLVKGGKPEALAEEIKKLMGDMPDVTIECSGAESSIHLGIVVGTFGDISILSLIRVRIRNTWVWEK